MDQLSLPKALIERRIMSHEPSINSDLVKLFGLIMTKGERTNIKSSLNEIYSGTIARMVRRSTGKPLNFDFYFRLLYIQPFGSTAEANVATLLRDRTDSGYHSSGNAKDTAILLRKFHKASCIHLSSEKSCTDLIDAL